MPPLVLDSPDGFRPLQERIRSATQALCLTGAGLGAGSGLATFRGEGGVYEDDGIADFHHASQLPDSLGRLWAFPSAVLRLDGRLLRFRRCAGHRCR